MATLAVAAPVPVGQPPSPAPVPDCKTFFSQHDYRVYARSVYLERYTIKRSAKRRLARMIHCQKSGARGRHLVRRYRRELWKKRKVWLETVRLTPYGEWAIPPYIVMCESGGNFSARNSSSTAGGAYQIIDSTWYAHGGSRNGCSHPAACAPPTEQHRVAARIWASGGASQWECA